MTDRMKEVRLIRCKKLLNLMKAFGSVIKFFSDEKIFTVDRSVNRRNDRWIASSSSEVHRTITTKKPASVMVICLVSSGGDVLAHIFTDREKSGRSDVLEGLGGQNHSFDEGEGSW